MNFVRVQKTLEENGIKDPTVACAAAFLMDNIHKGYPTADLVTSWPFTDAFSYLQSAGLVTQNRTFTEKGLEVYGLSDRKIYPVH